MDYEKAYNEALERAKNLKERYPDCAAGYEEVFPELRESEDEKMMNQLHSWMKEFGGAEEYTEKVYQWLKGLLEKQKEQNEITIEQVYKEFIIPEKLKDAKTNKYIRAQLLWELMHNGIITEVDYQYLTDDKRKPWTTEEYRIAYQKGFDMSEQLKQKEQKPAEWSEDDEEMAQFYSDDYNNRLGDKPMKWVLEMRLRFKEWLTTRLKSLRPRPQWKPSEEQMEALETAERWYSDNMGCNRELESLYEHLKKLM